jgi:hypothetical protein
VEVADLGGNYIVERKRVQEGESLHPSRHAASLTCNTHVQRNVTGYIMTDGVS